MDAVNIFRGAILLILIFSFFRSVGLGLEQETQNGFLRGQYAAPGRRQRRNSE